MGWLYVLFIALSFGLLAFFSRLGTGKGGKPEGITLVINASAALLTLFVWLVQGDFVFSKELLLYGFLSGLLGVVGYIYFLHALKLGHYGFTLAFVSASFLVPVLFSVIIWHEKLMPEGTLLLVVSTILIALPEEKESNAKKTIRSKWIIIVILAFLFNGFCQLVQAYSSFFQKADTFKFLFLNYAIGTLICLGLVLKKKEFTLVEMKYGFLGGLASAGGITFTIYACRLLPKNIVYSVYSAIYMLAGAVISFMFFKEKLTKAGLLGVVFGISGIILVSLKLTLF